MDKEEEKSRRRIYEMFETKGTEDYAYFDTAYLVHKDHEIYSVIPAYDEEEFADFKQAGMTIIDLNTDVEPAELAALAVLAADISLVLCVDDTERLEAAILKTCRPLLNMLHALGLRDVRIGLGVTAWFDSKDPTTPVLGKVLDLAGVRNRMAYCGVVWGWSLENLERITLSTAGVGVEQLYPPQDNVKAN